MVGRRPSKPGHVVARLDHGVRVTVEWTEPDVGGTDVAGYVIKYNDRVRVTEAEISVGRVTTFQFTNQLTEWMSYRFAVAAVNSAGQLGKFSEFTDYIRTECHLPKFHAKKKTLQ